MKRKTIIQVEGVNKWFGNLHVLKDITFEVDEGQVIVVCGPSGSGKSTLLRCINGIEPIQKGSIRVGEFDIHSKNCDLIKARQRIGMVFQHFVLFPHLTVLENITLAPIKVKKLSEKKAIVQAKKLLAKVGIPEKANCYPNILSGGQQQRVAIGRALAMEPALMMFDEPTSALDPELIGGILELMVSLAQEGMMMIVVTHEMGFAKRVGDQLLFLADGAIIETGKPTEVTENPKEERTRKFVADILA